MKCEILFSWKIKKQIFNLSSAEFAHSMLSFNLGLSLHCLIRPGYMSIRDKYSRKHVSKQ